MNQMIAVNDVQIEQIVYKDQPVVTFEQVADVHGISFENVRKSFQRNAARFSEGKHFYRIDFASASQLGLRVPANPNGITLFTEKGYLLLCKPMRDEKSWAVQERMIDEYFSLRELVTKPSALDSFPELKAIAILVQAVAEQRLELETIKATQHAHDQALIAQQAQLIETYQQAQRAESKADMAMDESQRYTLEEFILINGLIRQFPESRWKAYASWLGRFCLQYGLPVRAEPVCGKAWKTENTYPVAALAAWLRYEQTKPQQIGLDDEGGSYELP